MPVEIKCHRCGADVMWETGDGPHYCSQCQTDLRRRNMSGDDCVVKQHIVSRHFQLRPDGRVEATCRCVTCDPPFDFIEYYELSRRENL